MKELWGRCRVVLVGLVVLGQVGCAARGGVAGPAGTGRLPSELRSIEPVDVVSGEGRVAVRRGGFAETWVQETGRCTRETAAPVALNTYGVGLMFLPPVCAVMTAALPGMTTHFSGGRLRRAIQDTLSARELHAKLRDGVALATGQSNRSAPGVDDATTDAPGPPKGPTTPSRADLILQVTVTDLGVRDDGTLASVSARARLLRASDRAQLVSRAFTHETAARAHWNLALEPALAALSEAIVKDLLPERDSAGTAEPRDPDLPH